MNQRFGFVVSPVLVGCMMVHALEGVLQDKAPSEVHLITAAPLATSSSELVTSYYVQHNATFDKAHDASVPRETELRSGGLKIILA
jgi:hypothetical protein